MSPLSSVRRKVVQLACVLHTRLLVSHLRITYASLEAPSRLAIFVIFVKKIATLMPFRSNFEHCLVPFERTTLLRLESQLKN